MTSRLSLGRPALLLALALPLASCDLVFGSRPIGGGEWAGTLAKVEAPAADVFAAVSELLEGMDAGKAMPYPSEDSVNSVRVTWEGAWAKVAVDAARPYDCILSAFTMGERGGDELLALLLAGLAERGFDVAETYEGHGHASAVPEDAFQQVGNAYRMPGWDEFHAELYGAHGGHDDHGHDHDGHGDHDHDHDDHDHEHGDEDHDSGH